MTAEAREQELVLAEGRGQGDQAIFLSVGHIPQRSMRSGPDSIAVAA
jgi:hypothetical protein